MTKVTPVHTLVANVIGGSFLLQHAHARGVDPECLYDPDSADTLELYNNLTVSVGLDFELAASHVLTALSALLNDEEVSEYNIKKLTAMLWQILGDPEQNGAEPPAIYTEAGKAMYAWILVFIYPLIIKA